MTMNDPGWQDAILSMCVLGIHACPITTNDPAWQDAILSMDEHDDEGERKAEQPGSFKITTSVRQIHVSTWSLACFVCMVVIAASFIFQRISDEARLAGSGAGGGALFSSGSALSLHRGSYIALDGPSAKQQQQKRMGASTMGKSRAMVLTFLYAACAWMMSNGLVLNPRWKKHEGGAS